MFLGILLRVEGMYFPWIMLGGDGLRSNFWVKDGGDLRLWASNPLAILLRPLACWHYPGFLERSVQMHVEHQADVDRSATLAAAQTLNHAARKHSGRTFVFGWLKHTDGKSWSVHSSWKPLESRRC